MPVQALPPSNRPHSSIQPRPLLSRAKGVESTTKQSATLQDLPNELLLCWVQNQIRLIGKDDILRTWKVILEENVFQLQLVHSASQITLEH